MSLAAVGSARRRHDAGASGIPVDPTDPVDPLTLSAPFNGPERLTIPTPDATGLSLHPSVVDMVTPWNGWRYWMAHTPYAGQNVQLENPCIVVSSDGFTWVEPDGISNPIDPWPGRGYNSDTELFYDAESDRMVCYWRDYLGGSGVADNLVFCAAYSYDGINWSSQTDLIAMTFPNEGAMFSPSVWRVAPGDWRAWFIAETGNSAMWSAVGPLGPWGGKTLVTFDGTATDGLSPWHGDVYRTTDGVFRFIIDAPYVASGNGGHIYTASSLDGVTWSGWSDPVISFRSGQWDARLYRPTINQQGDVIRCWYSAYGSDNQPGIGHTYLPLSVFPAPPTP